MCTRLHFPATQLVSNFHKLKHNLQNDLSSWFKKEKSYNCSSHLYFFKPILLMCNHHAIFVRWEDETERMCVFANVIISDTLTLCSREWIEGPTQRVRSTNQAIVYWANVRYFFLFRDQNGFTFTSSASDDSRLSLPYKIKFQLWSLTIYTHSCLWFVGKFV